MNHVWIRKIGCRVCSVCRIIMNDINDNEQCEGIMAQEFKEIARFKTDIAKYNEGYERIFGKKPVAETINIPDENVDKLSDKDDIKDKDE